jgi:hypothetical protein
MPWQIDQLTCNYALAVAVVVAWLSATLINLIDAFHGQNNHQLYDERNYIIIQLLQILAVVYLPFIQLLSMMYVAPKARSSFCSNQTAHDCLKLA